MPQRFAQFAASAHLVELYRTDPPSSKEAVRPRYNLAPTQQVTAVRTNTRGQRELAYLRWGFIPPWKGGPVINARSETLTTTDMFKGPFQETRCIVPADGFYEWPSRETPQFVYREDRLPLSFAGLWAKQTLQGQPVETVTLVTCEPNDFMREIHHRMGVLLLDNAGWEAWLDPSTPQEALRPLLTPRPWPGVTKHLVSTFVNAVKNDSPACIEPVDGPGQGGDKTS